MIWFYILMDELLLLQVASEMGVMTLAWLVGKNFLLPELINQL